MALPLLAPSPVFTLVFFITHFSPFLLLVLTFHLFCTFLTQQSIWVCSSLLTPQLFICSRNLICTPIKQKHVCVLIQQDRNFVKELFVLLIFEALTTATGESISSLGHQTLTWFYQQVTYCIFYIMAKLLELCAANSSDVIPITVLWLVLVICLAPKKFKVQRPQSDSC